MRPASLQDRRDRLAGLRGAALEEADRAFVARSLRDRSHLMIAEAARCVAEHGLDGLIPPMLEAFDRLFENPAKRDPKCLAKTAIVRALAALDYAESPPFLRGAGHVQMEPVWGGQEDAAAGLRAASVLALVQCADLGRADIFRRLVDAMTDPGDPVRIGAVRAVAQMGGPEAAVLLRLKVRMGDARPPIVGTAFDALIELDPDQGVPLAAGYLDAPDPAVRDEAALSLGASRAPAAAQALIRGWNAGRDDAFREVLVRALASSRQEPAIDFLLDLIRRGRAREARWAAEALASGPASPELAARIAEAEKGRASPDAGAE